MIEEHVSWQRVSGREFRRGVREGVSSSVEINIDLAGFLVDEKGKYLQFAK